MTQLLQKIIYPIPSICSETELFYRTNDIVEIKEGIVFLTKGKGYPSLLILIHFLSLNG